MMLMRHLVVFSMLTASTTVLADTLEVDLNSNAAQFQYSTASGSGAQGKADLHAGFFYNNARSMLVNAGIMVVNSLRTAPGVSAGIGVEALAAVIKDNPPRTSNALAMALDGLLRYSPPTASQLGFVGDFHYAPHILAFDDVDRYTQTGVRVEYELAPQALVYVGYSWISFGINNAPSAVLENGAVVGFKIAF